MQETTKLSEALLFMSPIWEAYGRSELVSWWLTEGKREGAPKQGVDKSSVIVKTKPCCVGRVPCRTNAPVEIPMPCIIDASLHPKRYVIGRANHPLLIEAAEKIRHALPDDRL